MVHAADDADPSIGISVLFGEDASKPCREQLREETDAMMPRAGLLALVAPHDSKGEMGRAPVPDETTILNIRHLLEAHELYGQMLDTVNKYLESGGIRATTGSIVDATIIHAPSSTGDASDMQGQSVALRHENHRAVDAKAGLIPLVTAAAASAAGRLQDAARTAGTATRSRCGATKPNCDR